MAEASRRVPPPLTLIAATGGPDVVLAHGDVSIGHAADNTVVVADPQVPACAVRIVPRHDGWHLIPIDAPINVNGMTLTEATRLVRGDRLKIGRYQLTVTAPRTARGTPPPRSPTAPSTSVALPLRAAPGHDLELAVPRRGRQSSTGLARPTPEARAQAHDDARARMAWGHPEEQVEQTLVAGGYTVSEARAAVATMVREERAFTRGKGVRQVVGAVLAFGAGVAWMSLVFTVRMRMAGLVVVGLATIAFLHGLVRIVFGKPEGHRI